MRPLWKDILAAVWLGIILPGLVLNAFVLKEKHKDSEKPQPERLLRQAYSCPAVSVRGPDGICPMELEEYLTGVLLAEIPASFHEEALKAQAAAARTYTWKAHTGGGKHGDGSICTDPACCQAWISEQDYLARGGKDEDLQKLRQAVEATSSMVLLYEGELIEAVYFSSSGGETESALAVWGTDFPYLQSVLSPGEEESRYHTRTVRFTARELEEALGIALPPSPEDWFSEVSYTQGGGVDTLRIGETVYTGIRLRSLLNLPSTAFTLETGADSVTLTTRGYGHRVGLSQYGANAMARKGKTWQQILQHYYPGTTLAPIAP